MPDDERFEGATVRKAANVYYGGRVTSRELDTADGTHVSLGIILPGEYEFETDENEEIELLAGSATVELPDGSEIEVGVGESFSVPGASRFVISTDEVVDYLCRYG
ncbi:pyrimidine/purine nucleoside phosphorylase [Salinirubellus sp. GCM10025818]|uniref:pyrimidine/purine nucleoside phosphorylase n=1 Tax=Salinirubellus TaxID=2162630 RepID=UPI0030CBE4EE